jgi:hypothetical protein
MTLGSPSRAARFWRCVIDLQRRLLWRDGTAVSLTAKTFDVDVDYVLHRRFIMKPSKA